MTAKTQARALRWIRRGTQAAFLIVFLVLVLAAITREGTASAWLQGFFLFDPLVLIMTAVSAHTVPALLLLSLITILMTLLLGRVFCGWICPFGTVHAMVSALRPGDQHELVTTEKFSRWQRAKYYLLVALLVMALFGVHWAGVLDPFSLFYRATAIVLVPAAQYTVEEGATAVFHADPRVGAFHATAVTEPAYRFVREHILPAPRQAFHGSVLIAMIFLGAVLLNLYRKRFWCRYVCPLGAVLGLIAVRPILRLVSDPDKCNECGLCQVDCQGAAVPNRPSHWMPTECFMCTNCASKCNKSGLRFRFQWPWKRPTIESLDLSKRALVTSGVAGLGTLLMFRLSPQAQARVYEPGLIRPPGARAEHDFLARCIRCGLCMRVCPTNGLHPTALEAGLEGLWTPRLDGRLGYCEYECNACGAICPTAAIEPLAVLDKQQVKIGLATFDTARCLPWAYGRECMVCEEHCPIPDKAIHFIETDMPVRGGGTRRLKVPHVDPDRCIGCGICENKCVFRDQPAIRVTSANESRHSKNQPILPGLSIPVNPAGGEAGDPYGF